MSPALKPSSSNEQDVSLIDYNGAVNQLIVIAKKELEDIKHQINTANYNLAMIKDKTIKDTNELSRWKIAERQKFTDEMSSIQNDIIFKQNIINDEVIQQQRITQDLRTQQERFESLKQDQLKLKEELVKLEGKKIEVENLHKQAEVIRDAAISSQNQGSIALAKSSEETEKNRQENIRLSALNDSLTHRENKLLEDMKTHQTLKEFVEPKIISIQEQQESLERAKSENQSEISRLNQLVSDEKILLASIQDKKSQLEKDIKTFNSEKEEFQRQQTLSGK